MAANIFGVELAMFWRRFCSHFQEACEIAYWWINVWWSEGWSVTKRSSCKFPSLTVEKEKKSQGARSGEYGGCCRICRLFFCRAGWVSANLWDGALSWILLLHLKASERVDCLKIHCIQDYFKEDLVDVKIIICCLMLLNNPFVLKII